jgi:hypothetical protein
MVKVVHFRCTDFNNLTHTHTHTHKHTQIQEEQQKLDFAIVLLGGNYFSFHETTGSSYRGAAVEIRDLLFHPQRRLPCRTESRG